MTSSAEAMRRWQGPAILSYGFRPFFLFAGLWAALAMALWLAMLAGWPSLPLAFVATDWHAHSLVFGYVSAVIAGFLLTAVPNWTGRLPVVGWPLAGLAGLWLLGRAVTLLGGGLPAMAVMLADLAMPLALLGFLGREIVAGRNWRNLPVLGLLSLFALANALFHLEAAAGLLAHDGYGLRLGLATVLMLIALIGGRIVPSFSRNWLARRPGARLPMPFNRADGAVLALTGVALVAFVLAPSGAASAALLATAGLANLWRMARWHGWQSGPEPLLWVLHLAYAMLALGFLAVALAALGMLTPSAARHVWLAGAIGLMTLAVMTRASLGHAGLPLQAGRAITALYLALTSATLARLAAGIWPAEFWLMHLSAALWIGAFGGFVLTFWTILTRPRAGGKKPGGAPAP
ncbi:MAG: NnrS family protein [Pararhodobacter sp.]|nr:NnrS family protein [Pararhodobacter sp.]